ncbi:MAG: Enoyl-CoA hydratase [Ramlibacter sp.]|nr:Enoyl-CoA hydratase [Ramlibacter sp.]
MADPSSILLDLDAATGVAVLTLNRPEQFNAFDLNMVGLWREALGRVERDSSIRALVVTGAGKAFCAGGDMQELEGFLTMDAFERKAFLWENVHQIPLLLERIDCPVIAAINGTARGAGLDMALMCDLRVMDEAAVVAESYVHVGLMPGDGGAWFLPRLVGIPRALELLWTGDPIDAKTAREIGLVNRVAAPGQALAEAVALAGRIAGQPTHAVRFTKRAVYQAASAGQSLRAHLDAVSSHMAVLEDMPEFRARVEAFREKQRKSRG